MKYKNTIELMATTKLKGSATIR